MDKKVNCNINTSEYLVGFDFDGVLWDTVDECFYVGYKIFKQMNGEISKDNRNLRHQFRRARYLAKTGKDFYIFFELLKEDQNYDFGLVAFEKFKELREKYKDEMVEFDRLFYKERNRLIDEELDLWLMFQGPYVEIIEQITYIQDKFADAAICTTRDMKSLKALLSEYDYNLHAYGKDYSTNKQEQFKKLSKDKGISLDKMIFIDDVMENLLEVKEIGVKVMMAEWGYNTPCERRRAIENGIPLLKPEDLFGQLKNYCGEVEEALLYK